MVRVAGTGDPFPAADLDTSRGGRLTDAQRTTHRDPARAGRKDEFNTAVFCGPMAVLLLAPVGRSPNVWLRPLAGAGLIVVAFLLFRTATTPAN